MKSLINIIFYFFFVVIWITPVSGQMQKVFSPNPEENINFAYLRNFITDDTVRVVGWNTSSDLDTFNISFYTKINNKWENIIYSTLPGAIVEMNSYKNGKLCIYESDNLNDTIKIYKLNNNEFFVLDRVIIPSGVIVERAEKYDDWLVVAGQKVNIFSANSIEFHWFYHYENDNWTKKDEYEFEHSIDENDVYYSHNGIEINKNYVIIGSDANDDKGYVNGKVTVYKKNGNHWKQYQVIYQPDPYVLLSSFGCHLSLAPDNSFLAIGARRDSTGNYYGYNGCIYIQKYRYRMGTLSKTM